MPKSSARSKKPQALRTAVFVAAFVGALGAFVLAGSRDHISGAARFAPLIDRLKPAFVKATPESLSAARTDLYFLESLYRLYLGLGGANGSDGYPVVKALRRDYLAMKELEDAIGAFDEAKRLGRRTSAQSRRIAQLVKKGGWARVHRLYEIEGRLSVTPWPQPSVERDMFLERVASQLDQVLDLRYDMHEAEAGVHHLRKEMRWYLYYEAALSGVGAFEGLLSTTDAHCPLDGRPPKLSEMPTRGPCQVSKCLVDRTRMLDRQLKTLKRAGADAEAAGHDPNSDTVRRSYDILTDLVRENHLSLLAEQLRACKGKK